MIEFFIGLAVGAAVVAVVAWLRARAKAPAAVDTPRFEQRDDDAVRAAQEELHRREAEFARHRKDGEAQLAQVQREHAQRMRELGERIGDVKAKALRNCDSLAGEIGQLLGVVKTFERWHEEMNTLLAHNREMHAKSEEFSAIVEQVVIVALNAGIEAARAGEHGRGFAVVASEVRALAQRSASAAREIKDLIVASSEQVGAGSRLVEQAGATMNQVVSGIQRVSGVVAEISASSREQSMGIEQVNMAIMQMDDTTQKNAAMVEQSTASAKALEDEAAHLNNAVRAFVL